MVQYASHGGNIFPLEIYWAHSAKARARARARKFYLQRTATWLMICVPTLCGMYVTDWHVRLSYLYDVPHPVLNVRRENTCSLCAQFLDSDRLCYRRDQNRRNVPTHCRIVRERNRKNSNLMLLVAFEVLLRSHAIVRCSRASCAPRNALAYLPSIPRNKVFLGVLSIIRSCPHGFGQHGCGYHGHDSRTVHCRWQPARNPPAGEILPLEHSWRCASKTHTAAARV